MAISKILNMKDCGGHFHGKHLKRSLDYVMNPEKTQDGRLVGAINCQAESAFEQMKETKRKFGKVDKRQGYHIILSFKEDEVNPDTAFEITQKFVAEYLGSSYEAVFTFSFDGNQIYMSKNGKYVDVKNKLGTNLKMRLGGPGTYNDFNINGYLFVDEFIEDAIRGWLGSPEFLKSLANYYERNDIADDFAENCYNYLVSFKVATDKIDINGWSEKISVMRKTEILLRYAVNALSYYEINRTPFLQMDNPIIYLKRDYDVPKENIKKIWGLKRKPGKWTPVEIV